MKEVLLNVEDEFRGDKDKILALFDQEVETFSKWLAEKCPDPRARAPLSNPEKALMKTYLVQKYTGKLDEVA